MRRGGRGRATGASRAAVALTRLMSGDNKGTTMTCPVQAPLAQPIFCVQMSPGSLFVLCSLLNISVRGGFGIPRPELLRRPRRCGGGGSEWRGLEKRRLGWVVGVVFAPFAACPRAWVVLARAHGHCAHTGRPRPCPAQSTQGFRDLHHRRVWVGSDLKDQPVPPLPWTRFSLVCTVLFLRALGPRPLGWSSLWCFRQL